MIIARLALLAALIGPGAARAVDWPFFRGPHLNGTTPESDWRADWGAHGPSVAWQRNVGVGVASVVTQGDRAITMGNIADRDVVVCLDVASGDVRWQFDYPCPFEERMFEGGTAATPTIDGDRVYTLAYDGQVHCLAIDSGKPLWKRHLVEDFGGQPARWKYSGSPLVVGDLVIFDTGANGDSTLALDKRTGDKRWGRGSDLPGYATPIPVGQDQPSSVLVFKARHLVALNIADGTERWRIPWETSYDVNASSPVVWGQHLLVSSGYRSGRTAMFDIAGSAPRKLWQNDDLKTKMSTSAMYGGHVYGISEKKAVLLCLDGETGRTRWEERGFGQYGTLIIAGDRVVALTDFGELVIAQANPDRYVELDRAKVLNGRCWVSPVLSNQRIYARNNGGDLVCLRLARK